MKRQKLFSTALSLAVILTQLLMPVSRVLSASTTHPPSPKSAVQSFTRPPVELESEALGPRYGPNLPSEAPPRSVSRAAPMAPLAPAETVPFGTGNSNYGQQQRDTDNPQNHPGHHFAGSVNLLNGNYFLTVGDFFIPGRGLSLQLARSYNSLAASKEITGAFGYGWTHSYETHVISETGGMTVTVVEADGAQHVYTENVTSPCAGDRCYDAPPGFYRKLQYVSGFGYQLLYKNGTVQEFDDLGRLISIRDRHNNEISLKYDTTCGSVNEVLCQVFGPTTRRWLEFNYVDTPNGTFITEVKEILPDGSTGRIMYYNYEPMPGDLSVVSYPEGSAATYAYDAQHRLINYNDPRQPAGVRQVQDIAYDDLDRVVTTTYHVDSFFDVLFELKYDLPPTESDPAQGAVGAVEFTDGEGQRTRVEYDVNGNITYEGDWFPEFGWWWGKWWWWHPYPRWDLLARKVDANLHETAYAYDDWGNTTVVTNALDAVQRFWWEVPYYESLTAGIEAYGNIISATNSLGISTLYEYDYVNQVMTETQAVDSPEQASTVYQSDIQGQLVEQMDELGRITQYEYDEFGNTVAVIDAAGNVTRNDFDDVGRPITTTDQAGNATTYIYDESDRLLEVTDPEGGTTRYTYSEDGRDNLVQLVNANGVTTTYDYDIFDRLITQTNSLDQMTTYDYDNAHRLTRRTDADGRFTEYDYDAKSRMTYMAYYDAGAVEPYQTNTYRYDGAGNLLGMENTHARLEYDYDPIDQRTHVHMWVPTWDVTQTLTLTHETAAGNLSEVLGPEGYLVQYKYGALNRVQDVIDPLGGSTKYEYDPVGRLTGVTYPEGSVAGHTYDDLNHLRELSYALSSGDAPAYVYDYDTRGNVVSEVDDGEVYSYTYDAVGRVVTATSDLQGEMAYSYDPVGNRLSASTPETTTEFTYDAHNRLTQAGQATLAYNDMGARTAITRSAAASMDLLMGQSGMPGMQRLAPGAAQQAAGTAVYVYDNDMRLIRLVLDTQVYEYFYDPLGGLIGYVDADGMYHYYLRDGEDIYMELDASGAVAAYYILGAQGVLGMWRDGAYYIFLYDGRGRVRMILNQAGDIVHRYGRDLLDPGWGILDFYFYNPIRVRGAWWFPGARLVLFGGGVFWDPWVGVFLAKAWPWLYWPFGPFHPWRPIFRFWPWPWPWPRPWGWPWPQPWPFLWPWPGAWVRPWLIWPIWPWGLRFWWPWWYWRWWWGWHWWGHWWCWHPWWWFGKWWWWPWWHSWWWWGYWWFPWWWWSSCWWWPWHWWWWIWWWPWGWFWGPGHFWWCWWWWWPWPWWQWPWMWPPILGPPPEVGDAPDPPYASYGRNLGAMHGIWWFEWLGPWRDGEWDSDQIDNDWYDDGVHADPLAGTLTFTPTVSDPNPMWYTRYYSPGGEINVHGWIDWDRDGDWNMTDEFIVNWVGYPGDPAGVWPNTQSSISVTQPFSVPDSVFGADDVVDLWMRFRLDYATNFENPIDFTRFGEVEDQVLTVVRPTRPDWADKVVPIDVSPVITFAKVVTGVAVSIQPSVLITPVWSVRGSPLSTQSTLAATYGDQVTLEHARLKPDTVYTVSLSGGYTHPEGEPVLPSSFSFTATCTDVTEVELLLLTAGTLYTDTDVSFRADIAPDDATKPYTYTLDYDDGTPVSQMTSNDDPLILSHTFATTGVHEVVFSAWNCDMAQPVTALLPVQVVPYGTCVPVESVVLSTVSSTLYMGAQLALSADIVPDNADKSYTYTIDYDDRTPIVPTTSSDDPLLLTHSYVETGTYTIQINVWNCAMTVPATDTVKVQVFQQTQPPEKKIYLPLILRGQNS